MKSVVLVTGIGGMVGSHLADYYTQNHPYVKLIGTYFKPTTDICDLPASVELEECDVRYFASLYSLIESKRPEKIFHLAAQSYPPISWARPQETCDINITGTINLFEAIKITKSKDPSYNPKVIVACSSAQYGQSMIDSGGFVSEDSPLLPLSPYGVSKVAQDLLSYQYFKSDDLFAIRARIFNTTGPKKVGDVLSDFISRAVSIRSNPSEQFRVGNIDTERSLTDVRDLVHALFLLSEKGRSGECYNICGKKKYKVSNLIKVIEKEIGIPLDPVVDQRLLRPTDEKIIFGKTDKLEKDTGWEQSISIETTIRDMIQYWEKVRSQQC